MNRVKTAVLIGAGPRGRMAYLKHFRNQGIKLVAVADLIPENVKMIKDEYDIADDMCFNDYHELLDKGKIADAALICTNDRDHVEPFCMCAELGYHILLEKPVSPFPEEVAKVDRIAENYDKTLMICHVLRYNSFYQKIKEIIDSGAIGKVMSINHSENMSWWFSTGNYVRGKWNNSETTSPILLAKSCHDMDILVYLTGKKCKTVSSFGKLSYFKPENAPEGAGTRCAIDCEAEATCPYSAVKMYVKNIPQELQDMLKVDYLEDEDALKSKINTLSEGPKGRCVYKCGNNVCDHQTVTMEFEDDILVTFHLNAFNYLKSRTTKINGTLGEIGANSTTGEIEVKIFGQNEIQKYVKKGKISESHGGGDVRLVKAFIESMDGDNTSNLTDARQTLHSHMICFAAEESRLNGGKIVDVEEFTNRFKK